MDASLQACGQCCKFNMSGRIRFIGRVSKTDGEFDINVLLGKTTTSLKFLSGAALQWAAGSAPKIASVHPSTHQHLRSLVGVRALNGRTPCIGQPSRWHLREQELVDPAFMQRVDALAKRAMAKAAYLSDCSAACAGFRDITTNSPPSGQRATSVSPATAPDCRTSFPEPKARGKTDPNRSSHVR
jgi:hypothetical protein